MCPCKRPVIVVQSNSIDQGEVISPLLWCIYYDPLLKRVNSLRDVGYTIKHARQTTVNDPTTIKLSSEYVATQAYMDDTLWCSDSQSNLQIILSVANSFYRFTNIKTNDDKACLMTTLTKPYHPPGASIGDQVKFHSHTPDETNVKVQPYKASIRYLGVWISLDYNGGYIYNQAKSIMNNAVATMANARLTDNQLLYINNRVLIPLLEYCTQVSVLSKQKCTKIMASFIRLFKHRLSIASTVPNAILLNNMIYKYRDLYGVQLQAKLSNLQVAINHPLLLGRIIHLRLLQLQSEFVLATSPLHSWPVGSLLSTYKTYLSVTLTLAKQHDFSFIPPPHAFNPVAGSSTPLSTILSTPQYRTLLPLLRKYSIMFTSQFLVSGTNNPVTWNSFCANNKYNPRRPPSLWSKLLDFLNLRPSSPFDAFATSPLTAASLSHPDIGQVSASLSDVYSYNSSNPLLISDLIARETRTHLWAVLWSLALSRPIFVRIFIINVSPLRIRLEHWVSSTNNFNHSSHSNNIYYFTPCSSTSCRSRHQATYSDLSSQFGSDSCQFVIDNLNGTILLLASSAVSIPHNGLFITTCCSPHSLFSSWLVINQPLPRLRSLRLPAPTLLIPSMWEPWDNFTALTNLKPLFYRAQTLSFYTDGSFITASPSGPSSMGFAWIQVTDDSFPHQFSARSTTNPSAFYAELLAIASAIFVCPNGCVINIFSDCKTLMNLFRLDNSMFCNTRLLFKTSHISLLLLIREYISSHNLNVSWHLVQGHTDNTNNIQADSLAKQALTSTTELTVNPYATHTHLTLPAWQDFTISVNYRKFIRSTTLLKGYESCLQLTRFSQYSTNGIDWVNTFQALQLSTSTTSFHDSWRKRNLVLLLMGDLPYLQRLKLQQPHIYEESWTCCRCNIDDETFAHIWLCPKARTALESIIHLAMNNLITLISQHLSHSDLSLLHLKEFSFWDLPSSSVTYPSTSTLWFTDLIRGFIPSTLSMALVNLGIPNQQITSLLSEWLLEIRTVAWKSIWLPRCDEFQEFLRHNGITPTLRRVPRPTGTTLSTRTITRPTAPSHDRLSIESQAKVQDYFKTSFMFPFRLAHSLLALVY